MEFEYKVKGRKAYDTLLKHLNSEPEEIVNACDAGREGELIFREVIEHLDSRTVLPDKITRMWIENTTKRGLCSAWNNRRSANQAKYNRLAEAGFRRMYADWLHGINMTRYATAAIDFHDETIHIGRVKTPVLGTVLYREKEIRDYQRKDYYRLNLHFETSGEHFKASLIAPEDMMFGNSPTMFKRYEDARKLEREVAEGVTFWECIDLEEDARFNPPEPFTLLELQRTCNRIYKWTSEHTLEVAQKAYIQDKTITYPRTESHLLPDGMKEEVGDLHGRIWRFLIPRFFPEVNELYPTELNDYHFRKKIPGDHHGIIPTSTKPIASDLGGTIRDTYLLWELVTKRFLLSLLPPMEYTKVRRMMSHPDNEQMKAVSLGEIIIEEGWMAVEAAIGNTRGYGVTLDQLKNRKLPVLDKDVSRRISARTTQHFTEPPVRYNDDTLLEAMKNRNLGTAATRSDIIKSLIRDNYIERDSRGYFDSTAFGMMVADRLFKSGGGDLLSPRLTSYWEDQLLRVEKGRPPQSRENFLASVLSKVEELGLTINGRDVGDVPVLCPQTGEPVEECEEGYIFAGYNEMLFPRRYHGRYMKPSEFRDIIVGKRKGAILEFISKKSQHSYRARVTFRPKKLDLNFKPVFRGSRQ
jgi:DNA topoisomerase-3